MTPAHSWAAAATACFLDALARLPDADLDEPGHLPGWTRRHLVAHVASSAEALGRLLDWARTGVRTPMYTSSAHRAAVIDTGARRSPRELRGWAERSAATLAGQVEQLPIEAWSAEVAAVRGEPVVARQVPWLRARELYVHAVDLGAGVGFADLPLDFSLTLLDELWRRRSDRPGPAVLLALPGGTIEIAGTGVPLCVELSLPEALAWLTGRPVGRALPALPRWIQEE